jgi:hypothetical protein
MDWIKARLKERSTWRGLTILAGVCGVAISPVQAEMIATGAAAAIGLIETVTRD